jgi:hypothetical protein
MASGNVVEVVPDDAVEERLFEAEVVHLDRERLRERPRAHTGRVELLDDSERALDDLDGHPGDRRDLGKTDAEEAVVIERTDDRPGSPGGLVVDVEHAELLEQICVEGLHAADELVGVDVLRVGIPGDDGLGGVELLVTVQPFVPGALVFGRFGSVFLSLGGLLFELLDLEQGILQQLGLDQRLEFRDRHGKDAQPLVDLG